MQFSLTRRRRTHQATRLSAVGAALAALLGMLLAPSTTASADPSLDQDFTTASATQAPEGWTKTDVNTAGMKDGWDGWTFHTLDETVKKWGASGNYTYFTKAQGQVAIVESDQNSPSSGDFSSTLWSPEYSFTDVDAVQIAFDSQYRQGQNPPAHLLVSVDGGDPTALDEFADTRSNETVAKTVSLASGTHRVKFGWEYLKSNNNWYWMIDNVHVKPLSSTKLADFTPAMPNQVGSWTKNDVNTDGMKPGWDGWSVHSLDEIDSTWASNGRFSEFTKAQGSVAVVESDGNKPTSGKFSSTLWSPTYQFDGKKPYGQITFDSQYRSGQNSPAHLVASIDGAQPVSIDDYSADRFNETVTKYVELGAGAHTVKFGWQYLNSSNNWYWMIDNVQVKASTGPHAGTQLPDGFVTDAFYTPQTPAGSDVRLHAAGLWHGEAPAKFEKTDGPDWLSVSDDGVVSGTAPADEVGSYVDATVSAPLGDGTSEITVTVPVIAADARPEVVAATWNLWDAGANVDDALSKELKAIADNGLSVVGVQEDDGTVATKLADALGWYHSQASDGLGLVSAWPLSDEADATADAPAAAATADIAGTEVRVWVAGLSDEQYGPYRACFDGVRDPAALVQAEKQTTRSAQAQAVAARLADDVKASDETPLMLLGDLESSSGQDWTAATAAQHCGVGAVDWPVTAALRAVGTGSTQLTDSYRVVHPDPMADAGDTWSAFVTENEEHAAAEPQDRVDAVWFAGSRLTVEDSSTVVAGFPSDADPASNAWPSDHRAVTTTFSIEEKPSTPTDPTGPTDPTDPTDPVDPTDPTGPTIPVEPTDPTNPSQTTDQPAPDAEDESHPQQPTEEHPQKSADGSLAKTGSESGWVLGIGATATLIGALVLVAGRRRRQY